MKKILLSIVCFFAYIFYIQAQVLYGTTSLGGNKGGGGTINKFIPATNDLTVVKSFESFGTNPSASLIQASDGKLYGMTPFRGAEGNGFGTIYCFDPLTSTFTNLKDFGDSDGSHPRGNLVQASNGKLYGMTSTGGINYTGVIFSFDPSTSIYRKLYDFSDSSGGGPTGSLIQASDGKLYGMAGGGGINGYNGYGVIFSFEPSSATYTKLMVFDNTNGANPHGDLLQASDGKLYGMTQNGGSGGYGIIFSFDPLTFAYTKLKDFNKTDGGNPTGSLMQASDGKLYGMTSQGGINGYYGYGVIFSLDLSTSTFTKLQDFNDTNGAVPSGSLIEASDGQLFGMTVIGGINNNGVIFSFNFLSSTYAKLKDFDNTNDANPGGSLVHASDGKLYGVASLGGSLGYGVIFSFDPNSFIYTKLKNFGTNESGSEVYNSLVLATNGKLYGMTHQGGGYGYGVIFSIDPSSSNYTKLVDFDNINGAYPLGRLMQANNGKLYGMTSYGGINNGGIIFSLDPASSTFTKLKDFDRSYQYVTPRGTLLQADDGKLYGMTATSIFSLDPLTSTYVKLKDFNFRNDGGDPHGALIQANDGKLYGMANQGGAGIIGTIFSFDPASATITKLLDFDNTNGARPEGDLVQASNGKLYGMTPGGGASNNGVIFSFEPISRTYTKLKDFDYNYPGAYNPRGSMILASDGKLYGTTLQGGSVGDGVIFSFDPSTSIYIELQGFDNTNGADPQSAFVEVPEGGPLPLTLINFTGERNANANIVTWKTASEQNLNYFELQRSSDGKNFSGIYQTQATGKVSYGYDDKLIASSSSVYFYRLKSVDVDGNFSYSEILKLTGKRTANVISVNPNPFHEKIVVTVESVTPDKVTFILTDASGRQISKQNNQLFAGTNVLSINEIATLTQGTYLLTMIGTEQTQTIKVIKAN